jgi:hypothetical protein
MKIIRASILLVACTSAKAPPAHDNTVGIAGAHRASTSEYDTCVAVHTRARACTDAYIPALVDARARHDKPAGIAAKVAADRDGIIASAKEEWAGDSTDGGIAMMCQRITANLSDQDRADIPVAASCLEQQDCNAFTSCFVPLIEKHL